MRAAAAALAALLTLAAPAGANEADIAFWSSVKDTTNPAELEAYLRAFPEGIFVRLAHIRLEQLGGAVAAPAPAVAPAVPLATAVQAAAPAPNVGLSGPEGPITAIDRVTVELDARELARHTNLYLIAVPAFMPDEMAPDMVGSLGTPMAAEYIRTTLPPVSGGGTFELRVYAIAPGGNTFQVFARAPFEVAALPEGTTSVQDLSVLARTIGALTFEASYRGVPFRVAGHVQRIDTSTTDPSWVDMIREGTVLEPTDYVYLTLGHNGSPDTADKPLVGCVVNVENPADLRTVARLVIGAPAHVEGPGSTWGLPSQAEHVVLNPCRVVGG